MFLGNGIAFCFYVVPLLFVVGDAVIEESFDAFLGCFFKFCGVKLDFLYFFVGGYLGVEGLEVFVHYCF